MIQLDSIEKSFGGETLFDDLDWTIPADGSVIGFVGQNGVGKTTLFEILAGRLEPDGGSLNVSKSTSVGYLPQELTPEADKTVLEAILTGIDGLLATEAKLEELQRKLDRVDDDEELEKLSARYGEIEEKYRKKGGYGAEAKAKEIAQGLGFSEAEFDKKLHTFSGGWRVRAALGRVLIANDDILLLDEPTNHLDLESIEWLKGYIRSSDKTIVLISHDRAILNESVDQIAELSGGTVQTYTGTYDDYVRERKKYREEMKKKAKEQQKEIDEIKAFIQKFRYNASKASLVQSRIKKLEKMEPIEVPPKYDPDINFSFPQPDRIPKKVIELESIKKQYGDNVIFENLDLTLWRGNKIAVAGPNGAGKSTLLELLARKLRPERGSVHHTDGISVGYFAQHSLEQLDGPNTVLEELQESNPTLPSGEHRNILGALQIEGDEVDKQIHQLSGGEKARVVIAKILAREHDCILLDEPTNHLDIPSREVLEQALDEFEGVICVVSHDRTFLENITNKVFYLNDGSVHIRQQSFEDFMDSGFEVDRTAQNSSAVSGSGHSGENRRVSKKKKRQLAAQIRKQRRDELEPLETELEDVEANLQEAEERAEELEEALANPSIYDDDETDIQSLQKEYGEVESKISEYLSRWEELQVRVDEVKEEYEAKLEERLDEHRAN